ncbi:MAG: YncE family protein [Rhodospirillales bacterium]|nr:YncE family protein [Rhodospirillales bacterium]
MRNQSYLPTGRSLRFGAAATTAFILFALFAPTADATTIYTADEGQGTVSVFDFERGPVATVAVGLTPHNVDLTPDGRMLLVAGVAAHGGGQHRAGALVVVDASGDKPAVVSEIAVGQHPAHVVPSADGSRAFVTDAGLNSVHAVDLKSGTAVGSVGVGEYPHGLRLSPDGRTLAVANIKDGTVSIVDAETLTEKRRIKVGRKPVQVGFTPDGRTLLVTLNGEDRLAIVDLTAGRTLRKVAVGRGPVQVYATSDGKYALVANQGPAQRPDNRVCLVALDGKSRCSTSSPVPARTAWPCLGTAPMRSLPTPWPIR